MAQGNSNSWLKSKWQRVSRRSLALLKQSWRTNHNRIMTCGFVVLLCYLPVWFSIMGKDILNGSSIPLLNIGFIYLGLDGLWRQRHQLTAISANEEDRLVGYLLIAGGAVFFPFCLFSASLQALICMMIAIGLILCHWGTEFLQKNLLSIVLLLLSFYPSFSFLADALKKLFLREQLEYLMAWSGGLALKLIGQPVAVEGMILSLSNTIDPKKAVQVGSGCSGFDMAFSLAGAGLIMGLFFKQSWLKIIALVTTGVALALMFNVPRIMLLAFAAVYWGKESFEFWHGAIGGQIFATMLLTVYYYVAMAMLRK